jgi:hypothetical protein
VINGALGTDKVILDNKTRVGLYFADSGSTDMDCANYVARYIDDSEQSVIDAVNYIDSACN